MKTFVLIFLPVISFLSMRAEEIVVPADRATQAGNSFSIDPFEAPSTIDSVYGSENFSGPVLVNGLAFRLDETRGGQSFDTIIPRVTIRMTTYSGTYNSYLVGPAYNGNKGLDDTTVFDAAVHWVSTDLPGSAANAFDLKILFSKSFYYDPTKGALLMDIVTSGQFNSGFAIDEQGHGDPNIGWFGDKSLGSFVTQFNVTTVPEPRIAAFLAFAAALLTFVRRNKS